MRQLVRYTIIFISMIGLLAIGTAQTAPLPTTSPLPAGGASGTTPGNGDDNVTPPPQVTPTLPSAAKRSSLMIKRGGLELEWRLSYSHFSSNTVFVDGVAMLPVLVVGQVAV